MPGAVVAAADYGEASLPPSPKACVPVLASWKLAVLPADPFMYSPGAGPALLHTRSKVRETQPISNDTAAEDIFREARALCERPEAERTRLRGETQPISNDTAAEAIFREARARGDCRSHAGGRPPSGDRGKASAGASAASQNPTLLGRWRKAANTVICTGRVKQAEQIRVEENDFHRYGDNLDKLRQHQVQPVPYKPPVLSFKEAYEASCREPMPVRDPWQGMPNPETTRPSYESDLILNQVVPQSPQRRADSPAATTTAATPRTPRTQRALPSPAAAAAAAVALGASAGPSGALGSARGGGRSSRRGMQELGRRHTAELSPPLPRIRPKPRKAGSW